MSSIIPALRMQGMSSNMWVELIQLVQEHNPVNLGQGFPDMMAPSHITQALADATLSSTNVLLNQYTRSHGHPRLVKVLAQLYSKLIGRTIDGYKEVLTTIGADEAIFGSIMAFVDPGDEVIVIEPYFDCYAPIIHLAGGTPRYIPLRPRSTTVTSSRDWVLNEEELKNIFSAKTRMIIINTPNNPLGKVYSKEELEMIGRLCQQHNVIVLMDEVYEWMVYEGNCHVRMASLPDMWERTLTIGSAGKTFSVTGWKLGWVYGPSHLVGPVQSFHQHCVYTCPTPIQEAVAVGLEIELTRLDEPESYWRQMTKDLERKRDRLTSLLSAANMKVIMPEGGYFLLADFSPLESQLPPEVLEPSPEPKDYKFVKWLTVNKKLQGIPPSGFYSKEHKDIIQNYIRFCFFKEDSTLEAAAKILQQFSK